MTVNEMSQRGICERQMHIDEPMLLGQVSSGRGVMSYITG